MGEISSKDAQREQTTLKPAEFSDVSLIIFFQLLCLIGEAFDDASDEVCGAVVNIRNKGDKLALWTHDASKTEATVKIGYDHLQSCSLLQSNVDLGHIWLLMKECKEVAELKHG